MGGKTVTSEYANLFYDSLDRPDSQRVQSFYQILLRKERKHQLFSSSLRCLPTSASLSLTQIQVLDTKQTRGDYPVQYRVKVRTIDPNHPERRKQLSAVSSEIIIW